MSILHKIRRKTLFSRFILSALVFSLLLLPLVSWSSFEHDAQSSSHDGNEMEMSVDVSMMNCHLKSNSDLESYSKNCCKNAESNKSCKDCSSSCAFTVFVAFGSERTIQLIHHYKAVANFQHSISSRDLIPLFRPPITLLS